MKVVAIVMVVATSLLFNSVVHGKGKYDIRITQLEQNKFSVALINSYSDYYDQAIQGVFASRVIAEQAGQMALDAFLNSGVDDVQEPCSYDINWL
ncbi:MAG: hypothetical protein V3U65_05570 [Granulosicoccaceae bacterium]